MQLRMILKKTLAAGALIGGILASRANGAFTQIARVAPNEPVTREILSTLYGGRFFGAGEDFSNGFIRAERVSDTGGGPIAFKSITGEQSDKLWSGGTYDVATVANFSATPTTVGVFDRSTFTPLFNAGGQSFAATGTAEKLDMRHVTFAWGVASNGTISASEQAINVGGQDRVLTYRVRGLPWTQWLLFWQNAAPAASAEAPNDGEMTADFNDLVLQVRATGPGTFASSPLGPPPIVPIGPPTPITVPLPPAAWSGAATLVTLLVSRRRRLVVTT